MKQLSDLLDEVKASAPPARYDVEDVVAAGRRRQRGRNTGWAIAAVVAVLTAIGVPQIVTRGSGRPIDPVVTTTTTPATVKVRPFGFPFHGFTAGNFRVMEPAVVTLGSAQAFFEPTGHPGSLNGTLTVFHPGVDASYYWSAAKITDSPPINGGRAFFLDWPETGQRPATSGLAWQYADDAWAIVSSRLGPMKRASLTGMAQRFRLGPTLTARVGFRMTYVPDSYRLVQVDGPDSAGIVSGMLLAPAAANYGERVSAAEERSERGMTAAPDDLGYDVLVRLTRLETSERSEWPSTVPVCPKGKPYCYRTVDDGRFLLQVRSARADKAEMLKTLTAITAADGDDQDTWTDVNRAIPASAQLPAK